MVGLGPEKHNESILSAPVTVEKAMAEVLNEAKSDDEHISLSSDDDGKDSDAPSDDVCGIGKSDDKEQGLSEQDLNFHLSPMSRATEVAPSSIPSPLHHLRVQQIHSRPPEDEVAEAYPVDLTRDALTNRQTVVTNKLLVEAMEKRINEARNASLAVNSIVSSGAAPKKVIKSSSPRQLHEQDISAHSSSSSSSPSSSSSDGSLSSSSLESDPDDYLSGSDGDEVAPPLMGSKPGPLDDVSWLSQISLYDCLHEEFKADQSVAESAHNMLSNPDVPILLFKRRNMLLDPLDYAVDIVIFLNERAGSIVLKVYSVKR
jgi:hypothetical protein